MMNTFHGSGTWVTPVASRTTGAAVYNLHLGLGKRRRYTPRSDQLRDTSPLHYEYGPNPYDPSAQSTSGEVIIKVYWDTIAYGAVPTRPSPRRSLIF